MQTRGSPKVGSATPAMPAMKAEVWGPRPIPQLLTQPTRMVPLSPAVPWLPMSMLLLVVVRFSPASHPTAVLLLPVVLDDSAAEPTAVLKEPVVFVWSALSPRAVLLAPVVRGVERPVRR